MKKKQRNIDSMKVDTRLDPALRPVTLDEFVGQNKIKEQLSITIEAAKMREDVLDHILFCGPPGLGKTTLAYIMANMMHAGIKTTSGPVIDKPGDLAGLLTCLQDGDVLFIDEIHRLNHVVEEYLYSAMEDGVIDILIDKGPSARSIKLNLSRFTLIGATTRTGLLTAPLRSRFGMICHLDYYQTGDLQKIASRSAGILGLSIDEGGALEIAKRSRGTARVTNNLLKRVRDYALVKGHSLITQEVSEQALEMLNVDHKGLDEMDKKILKVIIENYSGGPVGINTLSVAVSEEPDTIEEVYEPFLILAGFLKRTPAGRCVTEAAWKHLGFKHGGADYPLFEQMKS
ncbi:MAG: Holliday junction branch migration DNA helicase RuvB [Candidatus Aureabacteria bacterium]|nr:Holliday junction branch migration DNA helicase RuvB [Candidatus Auribacterota bacterium]